MKTAFASVIALKLVPLCAVALFMLTFIMIKPVDVVKLPDVRLYPLYYFLIQPVTVWVFIPLAVFTVMFHPKPFHRILAALFLAFTVEFLPSVIMANPWLPDQYPYLAEAYWIYLHGRVSEIHYLSTVPGLGLTYGIFGIITNLSPFAISRACSLLQAIVLAAIMMSLSKKLINNYTLLLLLFLSFNYFTNTINTFHRAGLHFTHSLIFLYFVFAMLNYQHLKLEHIITLTIVFSVMVLTYPGSGFILTTIIGAYLLLYVVRKEAPIIKLPLMVLSIVFSSWYSYAALRELRVAGSLRDSLLKVLRLELSLEESMTHPFSEGLTPLFNTIVRTRLLIEGTIIVTGCLIALYRYISAIRSRGRRVDEALSIYALTLASLIAPAPWLLTEWSRWSFYKFSHYFLLFSLMSLLRYIYSQRPLRRLTKPLSIRAAVGIVVASALLLVPLLRYASMPYLHVTTQELHSVFFVHKYFTFHSSCYYLEYPPYILPSLLIHRDYLHELSFRYWFEDLLAGLYVITERALTRDGFYVYPQPLQVRLRKVENALTMWGDKVYDNGYTRIFDFI